MTPEQIAAAAPRRSARIAGVLYLIVIVGGVFAEIGARSRLVVAGNPAATAQNILAHEQLFRWGFATDVIAALCVIPLILLLYEIFKVIDRRVALLALFFSLVGTAVQATALLGHYAALILLKRGHDMGVSADVLNAQTYMALQLQGIGYAIGLAFFGGTMLSRGYLILHARFVPRAIGLLLMIEGICYWINSFANFVAPGIASTVLAILMVSSVAEVILCLWLLAMGVDEARWKEQALSAAGRS
jgi:uncharacterized protein DUF4386